MTRRRTLCCGAFWGHSGKYDRAFCAGCRRWLEAKCNCPPEECEFVSQEHPDDATGLKDENT